MIRRAARALGTYVSRSPVTTGYAGLLLSTHLWCTAVLSTADAQRVMLGVSTNLDNLQDHPLRVLAGSVLFFDGTLTEITSEAFAGTLITLGLGVIVCLAWLERRYGARRAYALFVLGHLAATLLTVPVIHVALAQGWYPESVRHATDFGISYGAETVLAASALLLRRARWLAAAGVVAWPVLGGDWSGTLPDFTTVGHLLAAAIGFVCGAFLLRAARRTGPAPVPQPEPAPVE
ncbi:rhomboid-like protein [Streptomyces angustmyceticus]|uniref:rhomboid-like protein n=1 Tax=Streptomyces angustmyceticus TaxID=285578 RepID=UPI0021AFA9E1|nr:rhomboid-like protein [Streptomyces angustmyceticus]